MRARPELDTVQHLRQRDLIAHEAWRVERTPQGPTGLSLPRPPVKAHPETGPKECRIVGVLEVLPRDVTSVGIFPPLRLEGGF
jgi:hypothetical protein